jgi:DNA-binding transcriptional MerR regulator
MTIGDISKAAGVAAKTIRFYEDKGLLPRPARSEGGYRLYGADDLRRLTFLRRTRGLGFSLSEARKLLRAAEHLDCGSFEGQLAREAVAKLAEVDALLADPPGSGVSSPGWPPALTMRCVVTVWPRRSPAATPRPARGNPLPGGR